jgi:F-type H+-transporting ATPase subunit gamma
MDSAEDLRRRIKTATELGSVVRTMKLLATAAVRQSEEALVALQAYAQNLELALQVLARNLPPDIPGAGASRRSGRGQPGSEPLGAIVCGSDQGMCGPYNDHMAAFAKEQLAGRQGVAGRAVSVWALGERLAAALRDAGLEVDRWSAAPGTTDGLGAKVAEVLAGFEAWRNQKGLAEAVLLHQRPAGPTTLKPVRTEWWPVDFPQLAELRARRWESRALPVINLPWQALLGSIAQQRLFVDLYRCLAESMAGENASRMLTMERAEQNIDERLEELGAQFNYVRQQSITIELLDIVAGSEAVAGPPRP